jgi:flagellar biosynthesis protein FliQ
VPIDILPYLTGALLVALKLAAAPLLAALVVGVAVALLQAVTQINDSTLAFLPKLAAAAAASIMAAPFMAGALRDYATLVFDGLIAIGGAS